MIWYSLISWRQNLEVDQQLRNLVCFLVDPRTYRHRDDPTQAGQRHFVPEEDQRQADCQYHAKIAKHLQSDRGCVECDQECHDVVTNSTATAHDNQHPERWRRKEVVVRENRTFEEKCSRGQLKETGHGHPIQKAK